MIQNKFGEMIWSESDVMNLLMQGHDINTLTGLQTDHTVDQSMWPDIIDPMPSWSLHQEHDCTVDEYHVRQQQSWHMPDSYKDLDIAQHVLSLCHSEAELQRCGEELLLYHERHLFDLLRYLTYLVAVMQKNNIIWGVGRGSSVSSHVLYLLGVHRINSLHYNLDVGEFLR